MSASSDIEWTDASWNCVRGCSIFSSGCKNCYAMKQAHRFSGPGGAYEGMTKLGPNGPTWTGKVELIEDKLTEPLSWRKPRKVFVNSMSDLFHEALPDEAIDKVFAVMALAPQHTFQILTKRADRMRAYMTASSRPTSLDVALDWAVGASGRSRKCFVQPNVPSGVEDWPLPNVWLGVSVENQHFADERIPLLLQTPAAVRFISAEPLLGPVDIWKTGSRSCPQCHGAQEVQHSDEGGIWGPCPCERMAGLHWVIVGGESGHGARPFDVAWARSIVHQCKASGVACFVKQLGSKPIERWNEVEVHDLYLHSKKGGDPLEWEEGLRVREFPTVQA